MFSCYMRGRVDWRGTRKGRLYVKYGQPVPSPLCNEAQNDGYISLCTQQWFVKSDVVTLMGLD